MTLQFHFKLLYIRIARLFKDNGVHPLVGFLGAIFLFGILFALLYKKIDYPEYVIMAMCLMIASQYSLSARNDFLKQMFARPHYIKLRLFEGLGIALPFSIGLIVCGDFWHGAALLLVTPLLGLFSGSDLSFESILTPFGRYPFEYASGIRKYILLLIIVVAVYCIAIYVGNFNLALFCLFDVFLSFLPFYAYLESPFFIWNHRMRPSRFLRQKWYQLTIYSLPIGFIMAIPLLVLYPGRWLMILGAMVVGYLLVVTMMLAKYTSYPKPINLPQAILFCVGLAFPPVLIIVLLIFWRKSIKRLNLYLQ